MLRAVEYFYVGPDQLINYFVDFRPDVGAVLLVQKHSPLACRLVDHGEHKPVHLIAIGGTQHCRTLSL